MAYDYIAEVDTIQEVQKFNPYHDERGRFATSSGATSFTYAPGKSKAHDNAIAREKERQAAAGGGKPMTNPSGDYAADRKKEWEGADYAVQIKSGGEGFGSVDLHSRDTDERGNSWAEGAYGNMKIYTRNGSAGQIYMVNRSGYEKAINAANKTLKESKDRKKAISALESELKAQSLRTVGAEYIKQQREAARASRR